VEDLRGWPDEKLEAVRENATLVGRPVLLALPLDEPQFAVPQDFVKILDRDLAAAGIPKRDERGRTVDVHALRHTFGTHLSKNGVAPRTAQAAMRHSSLDLTMDVYTDPSLLDVAGALDVLPELSLEGAVESPLPEPERAGRGHDRVLQFQGPQRHRKVGPGRGRHHGFAPFVRMP